jgi:hypothetical protein
VRKIAEDQKHVSEIIDVDVLTADLLDEDFVALEVAEEVHEVQVRQ